MPLIDRFDTFLLDLDGCVYIGGQPIPGSAEAICEMLRRGKHVRYLTNDPHGDLGFFVDRLRRMGLPATAEEVIGAGWVAARYLERHGYTGKPVFVVGDASLKRAVASMGMRVVEGKEGEAATAVLVADHAGFDYAALRTAVRAGLRGALLVAANMDPWYPEPDGPSPSSGSIAAAVEYGTGRKAVNVGKPSAEIVALALGTVPSPGRPIIIGDRLDADVAAGKAAGIATALVLTGSATRRDIDASASKPDYVLSSLGAALDGD